MDIFRQNRRTLLAVLMIPILGVAIALILITLFMGFRIQIILGVLGGLIPYLITLAIIWRKLYG